jgi:hypothetical protein
MSAVADVQAYLESGGLIGESTEWPSVRRRVHDNSDRLVILTEDGGTPPPLYATQGLGESSSATVGVQVRVRGAPWLSDEALALGRAITAALHSLAGIAIGSQTYEVVTALTADPVFIGFDEKGRPEFTMSFRLTLPMAALVESQSD